MINIKMTLCEYQNYVSKATGKNQEIDWEKVIDLLCKDGDWTTEGAEILVHLVRYYGSFVLRNAFALAIAAKIEDGRSGL
ncbi:MAG: hypothetical protein BWY69_01383 [Planctomycetes bacterium ADurb.Bin401]|nr:MAG: hypothetical protein BWY69_01383 [Planctomycetes bacterium ADurb.Bin401]